MRCGEMRKNKGAVPRFQSWAICNKIVRKVELMAFGYVQNKTELGCERGSLN